MITTYFPYPCHSGFQRVSSRLIELLSRNNEVYLASLYPSTQKSLDMEMAQRFCKRIIAVPNKLRPRLSFLRAIFPAIRVLFTRLPYQVITHKNKDFAAQVAALAGEKFDVVLCEAVWLLVHTEHFKDSTIILHQHNLDSEVIRSRLQIQGNCIVHPLLRVFYNRLRRFEEKWISKVDLCITNSAVIKEKMQTLFPSAKIEIIPICVDPKLGEKYCLQTREECVLVFVGDFAYYPNLEGILYFCKDIYPIILRTIPKTKLLIAGPNPPKKLLELSSNNIEILGFVEDIYSCISRAVVFVAPVRIGSGLKIKVVEAMALGVPVVTTSVGAKGLKVNSGEHLLVADTPHEFAKSVVNLLNCKRLASSIAFNAFKLINKEYSLGTCSLKLNSLIKSVVSR